MEKIKMTTPLVEMDGDENDKDSLEVYRKMNCFFRLST